MEGWLLVLAAALAMSVPSLPARADAPAAPGAGFLGLAVATSVTQGPDGLTEVDGIHNAIWSDSFPVTENLKVYTRWSGHGAHMVRVRVVDRSADVTLGDAEDSIDFGEAPVTWFAHDLSGTSFPAPGTYAVEVSLDGQEVAAYALFVNAEQEMPEDPAFVISVPAERGLLDRDGAAKVSGIFEYFSLPSFPGRQSFALVTVWFSGAGTHRQAAEIANPSGTVIARAPVATLRAMHGGMTVAANTFDSVSFPGPGLYTATIYLDDARVLSYPLVIQAR
ncbi:MAG TPA: hypothetical protein VFI08_06500 [Spirochaetia bacterium]|nr:hypothetical protein [Spirochaetia bacterium]